MAGIKRQKRFPIGYRIQNGRAEVVPEEAELVQRIFRDYLEGSTTYGIAKWMTELGVLNANGHPSWSHASIGNLLKNPRYCGDEYYPPIISKELFLQVQERRENRTSQLGRRYHPNSHAGKGILNGSGKSQKKINGAGNVRSIRMGGRYPAETGFCQRSR